MSSRTGESGCDSLLGRVVGELDALLDVALEALDGRLEQRLLLVGEVAEDVDGLLGTVGLSGGLACYPIQVCGEGR